MNETVIKRTKTGLIAGEGALPVEIARRLTELGDVPVVFTLRQDPDAFRGIADPLVRLRYPSLSRLLKEIRRHDVGSVVLAGRVSKKLIYAPALFDPLFLRLIAKSARDDHSLLAAVVSTFEEAGISVLPYRDILPEFLAPEGQLGHRPPTEEERRDFEYGVSILKVTLPCSFGQALVVAGQAVVALEALEGTDAMIERAGNLVRRGVLVKMMRVDQDFRYDLPTVGPQTIENMARAGLTCLAVEARRTLIIDAEAVFAGARRHNIAFWGLPCQTT
ncbi:MAG: UDP-2,3-diacylglucosamine diphosphatase LpxI [Synergistaceae bacterium]|jgi:DUF1009 family protein|nr:UDP-2,3-diacylglucosamine diphosphatase LpxI [Synergistaceae bacterium]